MDRLDTKYQLKSITQSKEFLLIVSTLMYQKPRNLKWLIKKINYKSITNFVKGKRRAKVYNKIKKNLFFIGENNEGKANFNG